MTPIPPFRRRVLIAWGAAVLAFAAGWLWRNAAGRRPDPSFSPLAAAVVRSVAAPLQRAEGARARVYAADPALAARTLEEAEFAIAEIARALRVEPPLGARIFLVPADGGWAPLARGDGFRPDSLAVNLGSEIFLKDDPDQSARPDRLAHELVHVALRGAHGPAIPLWLDEGLAGRLGLSISRAYRAARGRRLAGQWPGFDPDLVESLPSLTARTALPDDPRRAQAFYRASEVLVTMIEDMLPPAQWPDYVAEVARGADWRAALAHRLSGSAIALDDMENALRREVRQPRKL